MSRGFCQLKYRAIYIRYNFQRTLSTKFLVALTGFEPALNQFRRLRPIQFDYRAIWRFLLELNQYKWFCRPSPNPFGQGISNFGASGQNRTSKFGLQIQGFTVKLLRQLIIFNKLHNLFMHLIHL